MKRAIAVAAALVALAAVAHGQAGSLPPGVSIGYARTFGAKDITLVGVSPLDRFSKHGFDFDYGAAIGSDLTNGVPAYGLYGTFGYRFGTDKVSFFPGLSAYGLVSQADRHVSGGFSLSLTVSFKAGK